LHNHLDAHEEAMMIKVIRRSYIEGSTPEQIFAALSDPKGLTQLLPRVRQVEMLERGADRARLVTHMAMGGIFGTIRCEGELSWREPSEIVFVVNKPLPVETRWTLTPAVNGTEVQAAIALDLAPMLGAMAQFVPTNAVDEMMGKELESALAALKAKSAAPSFRERAVAA
jgi:carbon monoxide dehydrogenase subunit G